MRYKFSWIIQTLSWDFPWRKQKKILKMPHSKKIQQFELFLFIPVQIVVAALEESASARTASVQTAQRNNWRERPQKTRPGNYIFFLKKWKNKLKLARAWVLETVKNHHCLEKTKVNIIAFPHISVKINESEGEWRSFYFWVHDLEFRRKLLSHGPSPIPSTCPNRPPSWIKVPPKRK